MEPYSLLEPRPTFIELFVLIMLLYIEISFEPINSMMLPCIVVFIMLILLAFRRRMQMFQRQPGEKFIDALTKLYREKNGGVSSFVIVILFDRVQTSSGSPPSQKTHLLSANLDFRSNKLPKQIIQAKN